MSLIHVRTHPINVYYLTGEDARTARELAEDDANSCAPCFVTESFGEDGFIWPTAREFEESWADGPGSDDPSFAALRSVHDGPAIRHGKGDIVPNGRHAERIAEYWPQLPYEMCDFYGTAALLMIAGY